LYRLRERLLFEWLVLPRVQFAMQHLQQQHSVLDVPQRLSSQRLVMPILPQFLHSLH
jgi:hypothetical protein